MTRHVSVLFLILAAAGTAVLAVRPAVAQGPEALSESVRTHLQALAPLRGEGAREALFDGRPLLVKFFASW